MSNVREELDQRFAAGLIEDATPSGGRFMLEGPKAVLVRPGGGGSSEPRPDDPPEQRITEFRTLRRTDPHVSEMVSTKTDYIIGTGISVAPANVPYTDEGQEPSDIGDFKALFETSPTWEAASSAWVDTAITEGTAFLEIVVEEDVFRPKVLPTEKVRIQRDKFGTITGFLMENPEGGDELEFSAYDLAVLRFQHLPGEAYGRSDLEAIVEPAEMLRDMELDMARFIATKAYPPIVWKLGTEDRPWSPTEQNAFLDTLEDIEPESMLAVGHDVEHAIVGTTSTQSQAGMLNLAPTFNHLLMRMHAGMGIPPFLTGMPTDVNRNTSVAVMPKFDRRNQRYRRILRDTIRNQIYRSILGHPNPEEYTELLPDVEFGEHSSEEERLTTEEATRMFTLGFLTREAAAERMGIDPETELPDEAELAEITKLLADLSGAGDRAQNPNGGAPTADGTGSPSAEDTVKTRKQPEREGSTKKRDIADE